MIKKIVISTVLLLLLIGLTSGYQNELLPDNSTNDLSNSLNANQIVNYNIQNLDFVKSNGTFSSQSDKYKKEGSNRILLKQDTIYTNESRPSLQNVHTQYYPNSVNKYYLIQFNGTIKDEWGQFLENENIDLLSYIPENSYVVNMNSTTKNKLDSKEFIQYIGIYKPEYKISPSINISKSNLTLNVITFDGTDLNHTLDKLNSINSTIVMYDGNYIRINLKNTNIANIARINSVSWIEEYKRPTIFNDVARDIMNVEYVYDEHSLDGSGQIIAISDSGIDTGVNDNSMHPDLKNSIIGISNFAGTDARDTNGHGTHVSGSVVGDGTASNGQYKGTAPGANLYFQCIETDDGYLDPDPLSTLFQQAYDNGARIHSNSWGNYVDYDSSSRSVDEFMWNHKDMLILFAAGNAGPAKNTIGSPGNAKNCLTVGASKSAYPSKIANFSSRGPTGDNRIKPDIVAPGTNITSTESIYAGEGLYTEMSGTSMSTPLTAGAAALVRQFYTDYTDLSPTSSLIKAILVNGATDLGHSNDEQGWGKIDIKNSLQSNVGWGQNIKVSTGDVAEIHLDINDDSRPLKVTIAWTDYPGDPAASVSYVNDIDLEVISPSGNRVGSYSWENNIEQVVIHDPEIGGYTIQIRGYEVPYGPQPVSLVLSQPTYLEEPVEPEEPEEPEEPVEPEEPIEPEFWGSYVWDENTDQYKTYTWNGRSFSGFYYDLNTSDTSESMTITIDDDRRKIDYGDLVYTTKPIDKDFEFGSWGEYQIIGFMAERYFAGYSVKTSIDVTDDDVSLITDGILSKVLMDTDVDESIYSGSSLTLEEGYNLNIQQVDVNGDSVWISLTKDGDEVDDAILSSDETYVYEKGLGGVDDVPVIAVHIDDVFSGTETNAVFIDGIFQISDDYVEIDLGNEFGEMEVTSLSSTEIEMENEYSVSLGNGDIIDIMGKLKFIVADDDTLRFAPFVDMSEPGTYELRGTIAEDEGFSWTPLNFEGFYYDIDGGLMSESLTVDISGRTIDDGNLTYEARLISASSEYDGWGGYDAIGLFGKEYVPTSETELDIKLSSVLIDDGCKYALRSGETFELEEGYAITPQQIDVEGNKVWLELSKDGEFVDDKVINVDDTHSTWVYVQDVSGVEFPTLILHIDEVFQGQVDALCTIEGVWQISDNAMTISPGDSFGKMIVDDISNGSINMSLNNSLTLYPGSTINIMDDIDIKVADDYELRYYPSVEINIPNEEPVEPEPPEEPEEPGYSTYNMSLQKGWNLVSIPIIPESSVLSTFENTSDVLLPVYSWNAENKQYNEVEHLEIGRGYWVLALNDTEVTVEGAPYYP